MSEWDEFKWLRVIYQVAQHCALVLEKQEGRDRPGNNGVLLSLRLQLEEKSALPVIPRVLERGSHKVD